MISRMTLTLALSLIALPLAARAESKSASTATAADSHALAALNRINLEEMEMGKMGKDQAQSDQVRQYGEKLVNDHKANQEKVEQLAKQMNVTLPKKDETMAGKEHQSMSKLKEMKGSAFDSAFATEMNKGHKAAIASLQEEQGKVTGPVADLIKQTLPVIMEHQRIAQQLAMNPPAGGQQHQKS